MVGRQLGVGDQRGQRISGGQLHLVVDLCGAAVERAAEDAGEAEAVVDLVGEVGAPGADDHRAGGLGFVGEDFGHGVGHGEDNRLGRHGLDHFGLECAADGGAEENVGSFDDVGQLAFFAIGIGDPGERQFGGGELHVVGERALAVEGDDVLRPGQRQHLADGRAGRSGAVEDDFHVGDLLAHDFERVDHGAEQDHGGAVLVVVEHGNVADGLEPVLDLEAAGRGDVFEIDAAERGGDVFDDADDLFRVLRLDADGDRVDAGEVLEETAFALHHGDGRLGADVAEAEHGAAVADDGDDVALGRVGVDFLRLLVDDAAGFGDAGRVGDGQLLHVGDRHLADHGELAHGLLVAFQRDFVNCLFCHR